MCANNASKLSECCAAEERSVPSDARSTIGTVAWPPNMYRNFDAWFTISSIAPSVNSTKLIEATGRSPVTAAPTEAATMIASEIGMSITRSGAELARSARGTGRSCRPS